MKLCKKCQCEKPLAEFYKNKATIDGVRTVCKSCDDLRKKAYSAQNSESVAKSKSDYRLKNLEKISQYLAWWRKEYSYKMCSYANNRRALLLHATPRWAEKEKINEIYRQAAMMNKKNPEMKYQVDHIIPLNSELVCGLHTHENMQILPATQNQSKGNLFQIEGAF